MKYIWICILVIIISCNYSKDLFMRNHEKNISLENKNYSIFHTKEEKICFKHFIKKCEIVLKKKIPPPLIEIIENYFISKIIMLPKDNSTLSILDIFSGKKIKDFDLRFTPYHLITSYDKSKLFLCNRRELNILDLKNPNINTIKIDHIKGNLTGLYRQKRNVVSYTTNGIFISWNSLGVMNGISHIKTKNIRHACGIGKDKFGYLTQQDKISIGEMNNNSIVFNFDESCFKLYSCDNSKFISCGGYRDKDFNLWGKINMWDVVKQKKFLHTIVYTKDCPIISMVKISNKNFYYFLDGKNLSLFNPNNGTTQIINPNFYGKKIYYIDEYSLLCISLFKDSDIEKKNLAKQNKSNKNTNSISNNALKSTSNSSTASSYGKRYIKIWDIRINKFRNIIPMENYDMSPWRPDLCFL